MKKRWLGTVLLGMVLGLGTAAHGSSLQPAANALIGASEKTEEGSAQQVQVTDELPVTELSGYPRVDGSLACVPMMEALAVRVTGCSQAEAEMLVETWFTNTNPCYLQLCIGARDMLLAYEPSGETLETLSSDKEMYPFEPQMTPVGKDALVFMVNKDNPVESLTQQQLTDIFTGKVTNWKEVGGEDQEIRVFTRPENSGSQTLMRKLLLGDAQMPQAQTEEIPSMEGMLKALLDYTNEANAIGYSVYYYASMMYDQPDLKFLKVDGTAPENESIRTGEYPLINPFYCVTSDVSSQTALQLKNWLLSDEGQAFVEECGYVPAR